MLKKLRKQKGFRKGMALLVSCAMVLTGLTGFETRAAEGAEYGGAETVSPGDIPENGGIMAVSGSDEGASAPGTENPAQTTEYVLEAKDLTAFSQGTKTDGETESAGTENYFTLLYSAKTKIDSSSKSWEDGYSSGQRINFGGNVTTEKNAVKFTTSNPATVKIWWAAGDADRQMGILNASGEQIAVTSEASTKNTAYFSTLELSEAGTYYLGGTPKVNYIFKVVVSEEKTAEPVTNVLEAKDLTAFAAGAKQDGETESAGTENYFTLLYSAKTKIDSSTKNWEDGYSSGQRINFGGNVTTEKNAVKFTTSNPATVKIWWAAGDADRQMGILNASGEQIAVTSEASTKNTAYFSTLELSEAGTYYLGGTPKVNYIFKVEVTETPNGTVKPPRADWSSVAAPVIVSAAQSAEKENTIEVTVQADVGYDGADKVVVTMADTEGTVLDTKNSSAEKAEHTVTFTPKASGTYTFSASVVREGEEAKSGAETKQTAFLLKLAPVSITSATSKGRQQDGTVSMELCWTEAAEATGYEVSVEGTEITAVVTELSYVVTGLTAGEEYTFVVKALRGGESSAAASLKAAASAEVQTKWSFAAFGQGVDTKNNGYSGNANDGEVVVYSKSGKGKLVPASTDGLAFYYTEIDPETTNFTLTATAKVNSWTLSNGQEGFGLMAADRVGVHGDSSAFWNNSYMASVTKVEYFWDGEKVSDAGDKISMKLGVGSQEKVGVTADNINAANALNDMSLFSSRMTTLETSCAANGTGTYNLVGGYTAAPTGTVENPVTEFKLSIQKNNTGYFASYTDAAGKTITNKYYGTDALSVLDEDAVYVGFFASRNADITFTDISFTTIAPEEDAPAEERDITYVTPSFYMESASTANAAAHELVYYGNADGQLLIKDETGNEIYNAAVAANQKVRIAVTLAEGKNNFAVTMTPDAAYRPSAYEKLSSYEAVSFTHTVEYRRQTQTLVYVAPDGKADGAGTKESPLDIYTAVKWAMPGQQILLMEGRYELSATVTIPRGMNGTEDNRIYLMADPAAASGPVLDFNGQCAGMILGADYWYLQGFDVTGSADAQKGLQISGSHNVVDKIHTYKNGNTGLQISRLKSTDQREEWPSDNLILNCTSYLNADRGYEDADGFAAKLTIGEGNVFDGCIAAYNADDGWDFFAKPETGQIGKVVIKNCVAFKNGYVLDENGNEIVAGNGNGFKMGGGSISGHHELVNSYAFGNRAKGFDSNSCPDICVRNSISFENESYNVAFYTNDALNTDFSADGIISYKTKAGVAENIKAKGTQDTTKIYKTTNYFFDGSESKNTDGEKVSADWFVSLDMEAAIRGGITRNADGSIHMGDFLKLTEKAPAGIGADGKGTPSKDIGLNQPETNPGTTPDPTPGTTPEPNPGTTPEPNPGTMPEPNPGTMPEPNPGTTPEPNPGATPEPNPGTTTTPAAAPTPTPAPLPTATPAPVPATTLEPSAGTDDSGESTVEQLQAELAAAVLRASGEIAAAETPEALVQAVESFVGSIREILQSLAEINVAVMRTFAQAETAIAETGVTVVVDDEGTELFVTEAANALFTLPSGGSLVVKDADLTADQKDTAQKNGITQEQLQSALILDIKLLNGNGEAVQPVIPLVISFEIPEALRGKELKLLHYTADGVEILEVEIDGSRGSVVVNGFSTFALIATEEEKAAKEQDASGTDGAGSDNIGSPVQIKPEAVIPENEKTGSGRLLTALAIVAVCAAAAGTVYVSYRKRKKED